MMAVNFKTALFHNALYLSLHGANPYLDSSPAIHTHQVMIVPAMQSIAYRALGYIQPAYHLQFQKQVKISIYCRQGYAGFNFPYPGANFFGCQMTLGAAENIQDKPALRGDFVAPGRQFFYPC